MCAGTPGTTFPTQGTGQPGFFGGQNTGGMGTTVGMGSAPSYGPQLGQMQGALGGMGQNPQMGGLPQYGQPPSIGGLPMSDQQSAGGFFAPQMGFQVPQLPTQNAGLNNLPQRGLRNGIVRQ